MNFNLKETSFRSESLSGLFIGYRSDEQLGPIGILTTEHADQFVVVRVCRYDNKKGGWLKHYWFWEMIPEPGRYTFKPISKNEMKENYGFTKSDLSQISSLMEGFKGEYIGQPEDTQNRPDEHQAKSAPFLMELVNMP